MQHRAAAEQATILENLRSQFQIYYSTRIASNQKVPDDLVDAVLAAVQSGIPPGLVNEACQINRSRIHRWRSRRSLVNRPLHQLDKKKVRVLKVVDSHAHQDVPHLCFEFKAGPIDLRIFVNKKGERHVDDTDKR